ncbi:hypothetical protein [Duganella vulcania]|uniref:Uncharacterized protein n=1 Tax=Duganella vulcania TaxID=2692166 RepID=A0A845GEF0_9BURK|nr:hypothetical protein [Duganella vulcania]MYM92674.1 hypothetical protein [Duganella vulcania]
MTQNKPLNARMQAAADAQDKVTAMFRDQLKKHGQVCESWMIRELQKKRIPFNSITMEEAAKAVAAEIGIERFDRCGFNYCMPGSREAFLKSLDRRGYVGYIL